MLVLCKGVITLVQRANCKSITLFCRSWFNRHKGGTRYTVQIIVDGELKHKTGIKSGYGNDYVYTAQRWLEEYGHIPVRENTSLWTVCNDLNIALYYTSAPVATKGDL